MKKLSTLILSLALVAISANLFAQKGYNVGDQAKDFSLKNTAGKMVSFSSYPKAKGFIVVFTCNHCPFAKAYEQRIINLHKKYSDLGYPVIAINPNDKDREPEDSYENMQKRAKEKSYPFPYLYDESQATAKEYGATRTPHVFIVTKTATGNEVKYIGAIDDNYEEPEKVQTKYAEDALNALLANKPVTTSSTKAIGCGIKWKKEKM